MVRGEFLTLSESQSFLLHRVWESLLETVSHTRLGCIELFSPYNHVQFRLHHVTTAELIV